MCTKTCPASSPHYQVNEIERENCRNRPERKNNYRSWWSWPHKNTMWLTSGKNEGPARGNCHKGRVMLEKQDLSLDLQGSGAMAMTSHAGPWINHSCTAQEQLQIPQGQSWVSQEMKDISLHLQEWFHQEVFFKQHNTDIGTNLTEIPFQDFPFWKTAGIFPLPFPTGKTYRSFCASGSRAAGPTFLSQSTWYTASTSLWWYYKLIVLLAARRMRRTYFRFKYF